MAKSKVPCSLKLMEFGRVGDRGQSIKAPENLTLALYIHYRNGLGRWTPESMIQHRWIFVVMSLSLEPLTPS